MKKKRRPRVRTVHSTCAAVPNNRISLLAYRRLCIWYLHPAEITYTPCALSLCDEWVGYRHCCHTPGSEAFVGLYPPAMCTHQVFPPILFPACCVKPSSQTPYFFAKLSCVHAYTHVPLLRLHLLPL